MNSKDFRIGNLVYQDLPERNISTIEAIDLLAMAQCEVANHPVEFIEPILITEDWLIILGFEKKIEFTFSSSKEEQFNVYRKGALTYNSIQNAWWLRGVMDHFPKYVHQLQNLYFALTGKELLISKKEKE